MIDVNVNTRNRFCRPTCAIGASEIFVYDRSSLLPRTGQMRLDGIGVAESSVVVLEADETQV